MLQCLLACVTDRCFPSLLFNRSRAPCAFTLILSFLRSSPAFAAPLIYLCYIFLSFPFSVTRIPSRVDVLPFLFRL